MITRKRTVLTESHQLQFAPGARLQFDNNRHIWLLMGPEKVIVLDEIAAEIFKAALSPSQPLSDAIDQLSQQFDAPRAEIARDVLELLQDFTDRRFLSP